ncbi:hypothetical protein ONZ43_g3016 [Nemania bipapillata]|uniref:Uncharacterized protein n=1 Tax=Nemania bipapillata TaxID=110536 RepID=A0ACC2IYK7_9PEZI|nr:hypothetical protein ONZ43_g3016 [Nemania bipapillata]
MDPLSITASVIAVTSLAWKSCKAAHDLVDRLAEAPQIIAKSRNSLNETQKTLDALRQILNSPAERSNELELVLRKINVNESLESAKCLCDDFAATVTTLTSHSGGGNFSKRDRLMRTLSMVVGSMNLIIASQTADDVRRLGSQFQTQEQALADLVLQLHTRPAISEESSSFDGNISPELTTILRKVCQETFEATRAKRTGQSFGDMSTDDQSQAMQGIVGNVQDGVEQSFGKMTTSKNSRAFQGQVDAASFAVMFGNRS